MALGTVVVGACKGGGFAALGGRRAVSPPACRFRCEARLSNPGPSSCRGEDGLVPGLANSSNASPAVNSNRPGRIATTPVVGPGRRTPESKGWPGPAPGSNHEATVWRSVPPESSKEARRIDSPKHSHRPRPVTVPPFSRICEGATLGDGFRRMLLGRLQPVHADRLPETSGGALRAGG